MRRADLLAVRAWNDQAVDTTVDTTVGDHRRFTDPDHPEETERALLPERLAGWSSRYPDVVVRQTVVRGRSAPALLEFGNGAQLVAVRVVDRADRGVDATARIAKLRWDGRCRSASSSPASAPSDAATLDFDQMMPGREKWPRQASPPPAGHHIFPPHGGPERLDN